MKEDSEIKNGTSFQAPQVATTLQFEHFNHQEKQVHLNTTPNLNISKHFISSVG
jgi:hypothetical protein